VPPVSWLRNARHRHYRLESQLQFRLQRTPLTREFDGDAARGESKAESGCRCGLREFRPAIGRVRARCQFDCSHDVVAHDELVVPLQSLLACRLSLDPWPLTNAPHGAAFGQPKTLAGFHHQQGKQRKSGRQDSRTGRLPIGLSISTSNRSSLMTFSGRTPRTDASRERIRVSGMLHGKLV